MTTFGRVVLATLLTLTTATSAFAAGIRAGAHAQDITPLKFPISVNGGMADSRPTNPVASSRCNMSTA